MAERQRSLSTLCFITVALSVANAAYINVPGLPDRNYYQPGDLDVALLFDFSKKSSSDLCSNESETWTYPFMEAARYVYDKFNKDCNFGNTQVSSL